MPIIILAIGTADADTTPLITELLAFIDAHDIKRSRLSVYDDLFSAGLDVSGRLLREAFEHERLRETRKA